MTRTMRCAWVLLAASALLGSVALARAAVELQPGSDPIAFAANEIRKAAEGAGAHIDVTLGTYRWTRDRADAGAPPDVAEAFAIHRNGNEIVVAGHDAIGAMYGGLEVAEQLSLGGLDAVASKKSSPFLVQRQYKYNMPALRDQEWLHSREYWQSLFDLFARSRINAIGFWKLHPFPDMIRMDEFPEAKVLSDAQIERSIQMWRMIFRLARERGVATYLINWNIHLPDAFAEKHGLKDSGEDAPIVRRYTRYCVAETLKTYPDLTGIGTCAGERMPTPDYDWREQWIRETFLAGIADSGRTVPLLHRYWYASCDSIRRIICPAYNGPISVPLKFNGEHMYSGLRPHFLDPEWIDYPDYRRWLPRYRRGDEEIHGVVSHLDWIPQKPYPYKVIWHLRNDCVFTYRWGDPEFVKQVVRNCAQDYSLGYLMGQERTQPGIDTSHTEAAQEHQSWKYEHQRHWFRFMLWGRLGYDPNVPDDHWVRVFARRFGPIADDLLTAYRQASQVIPLATRFHFNYMNGDWAPEWCSGSWNTGFGRGYNWRDRRDFHDVIEFVFNHTIHPGMLDIPEMAGMELRGEAVPDGTITPMDVADEFDRAAAAAEAALARVYEDSKPEGEVASMCLDFAAMAELGRYYARKVRGAAELGRFYATGDPARRQAAVRHLESALAAWERLAGKGEAIYRNAARGSRSYRRMLPRVQRDIVLAKSAVAAPEKLAELGVFQRQGDRPRFDFSQEPLDQLVRNTLAPATEPLFTLDQVELSPKTCDVLVIGREAWGFNDLPAEKKQVVLDAVSSGVGLVLFFQNFPQFDASWLPGNIDGADHDYSAFSWKPPEHPIAEDVDPRHLEVVPIINDALSKWDEQWTNLTDPPGGVLLCEYGRGKMVFCQLDVLGKYREPSEQRLVRNLLQFAGGKNPRTVVIDAGNFSTIKMLEAVGVEFRWIDELPLAK